MNIELTECPDILREEVHKHIENHPCSKVICVSKVDTTPYKDKTITSTIYGVTIEDGNYFTSLRFAVCTNNDFADTEVSKESMNAGQIYDIINNSKWFENYRKQERKGNECCIISQ